MPRGETLTGKLDVEEDGHPLICNNTKETKPAPSPHQKMHQGWAPQRYPYLSALNETIIVYRCVPANERGRGRSFKGEGQSGVVVFPVTCSCVRFVLVCCFSAHPVPFPVWSDWSCLSFACLDIFLTSCEFRGQENIFHHLTLLCSSFLVSHCCTVSSEFISSFKLHEYQMIIQYYSLSVCFNNI